MMRQRRWLPRRTPPPLRTPNPSRPELDPRTCCSGWLVSGHIHDASQPGRRGAGQRPPSMQDARPVPAGRLGTAGHASGTPCPLRHAGPAPNGQARRSTAQLRRPLFPIARADSGVQVPRTPRPARSRDSPGRGSRWLAQGGGKVVPRRPEIGWFTEPHASAARALPVQLARVPPRPIAVQAQPAPDVGTHGSYCPPALMARQEGSVEGGVARRVGFH